MKEIEEHLVNFIIAFHKYLHYLEAKSNGIKEDVGLSDSVEIKKNGNTK